MLVLRWKGLMSKKRVSFEHAESRVAFYAYFYDVNFYFYFCDASARFWVFWTLQYKVFAKVVVFMNLLWPTFPES